jgi:flagellar protein FliL
MGETKSHRRHWLRGIRAHWWAWLGVDLLSPASSFQRAKALPSSAAARISNSCANDVRGMFRALSVGMSEAAAAEKPPAPAGGNKMLLLLVLVVNVLIAGGLAYVVISGQKNAAAKPAAGHGEGHGEAEAEEEPEHEEASDGHGAKKGPSKFGPLVEVGTFVANLTAPNGASRYAKVGLHVEATNDDAKLKVEAAIVPIRNEALMYLSGLQADQAIGQEKIKALQDELLKRLGALVGKNTIRRVYFSEFVIQ